MQFHQLLHSGRTEGAIEVSVQLHLGKNSAELEGGRRVHLFTKVTYPLSCEQAAEIKKYKRGNLRPDRYRRSLRLYVCRSKQQELL